MVDRERILAKLDALDGYLAELRSIAPAHFDGYRLGDFDAFKREVLAFLRQDAWS